MTDWREQKMRDLMDQKAGQGWWDRMHDEKVEEARVPIDGFEVRLLSIDREATYEQAAEEMEQRMINRDK